MTKLYRFISVGAFFTAINVVVSQAQTSPPLSMVPPQQLAAPQPSRAVQTVVAQGVGKDIESAAKNAAENALIQVVGSFVQSDKVLNKRSEINDGIRRETRSIDTKLREYSQGSIKSFELLDSAEDNGLYRVSARIEVRVEDFKAFVAKFAEGEAKIDSGIFAQVATQASKRVNAHDIILNTILMPYLEGKATDIVVGKPQAYSEWMQSQNKNVVNSVGSQPTIVLPLQFNTNPSFLQNARQTLDSIAFAKKRVDADPLGNSCSNVAQHEANFRLRSNGDIAIAMSAGYPLMDVWLFKDSGFNWGHQTNNSLNGLVEHVLFEGVGSFGSIYAQSYSPNLLVSLVGDRGIIKEYIVTRRPNWAKSSSDGRVFVELGMANGNRFQNDLVNLGMDSYCLTLMQSVKTNLFMNIEPDVLAMVKYINVKLAPR